MKIKDLKELYAPLAKKYGLPGFKELNENFEIESLRRESEFMLKAIRKIMMAKVANALSFVEMVVNPVNAPRFYLVYIKSMSSEGRKEAEKVYERLSKLIKAALNLELEYSEKKEADMILLVYNEWNLVKPEFKKMLDSMEGGEKNNVSKEKSYFG